MTDFRRLEVGARVHIESTRRDKSADGILLYLPLCQHPGICVLLDDEEKIRMYPWDQIAYLEYDARPCQTPGVEPGP